MVAADKTTVVLPQNVVKYLSPDGKSPFDQWRKRHRNTNIAAAIDEALDRVRLGKAVKAKKYGGGISAIVLSYPRKIRIYYGLDDTNTVVLLGGDESQQSRDIENAQSFWKDYLARENEDA